DAIGWVLGRAPWVAEGAWSERPFSSLGALPTAMTNVVAAAGGEKQLELLRAHPDLGTRARMSDASAGEQAGAGLDRMSPADFARLQRLNKRYRQGCGVTCMRAVKG